MKAITRKVLTSLLIGLMVFAVGVQSAVAVDDIWPMFRHDLEHTGRSPYIGAQGPNLKWKCALGAGVYTSSPAIALDGTIYIGANDGNLYAIHPNGVIKWSYPIGGNVYSSPAIGSDGTIYIGLWRDSGDGTGALYAINPDGSLMWRYPETGYILDIESSPAVDPVSGVIYVGGACQDPWGGKLYAINPDGTLKCTFDPDPAQGSGWMPASPAIRGDGKIIMGDYSNPSGIMWAINPGDCSVHDYVEVGYDIKSSAAIDSDRLRIYFGNSEDTGTRLWAYDFNLDIAWYFPTGGHVRSSPAVGPGGTIYVGSCDNRLYAVNPDGTEKWHYTTGGEIHSSPAVGADGTIYVGSNDHSIYAIDSTGTLRWSYTTGGAVFSSPAIGSDGMIYVGSGDGYLYCLGSFCRVSPVYLDFGAVVVGSYLDRTFTITNLDTVMLSGSVTESCDHYGIVAGGGPYNLAPAESLVVTVRFEPASVGVHDCTIETGNALCCDVFCTGAGDPPPACLVEPDSLDFGTVTVGASKDTTFTITNTGGGTLSGNVSEACSEYSIISGGGPFDLTGGQSVIVTLRFQPTSPDSHECGIETGQALCSDVSCTGVGELAPLCLLEPDSLDFGTVELGAFRDTIFTITNTGADTLHGDVSESCDHYSIISGSGPFDLTADQSVTVTVRFQPTAYGRHGCAIQTGQTLCGDVACVGACGLDSCPDPEYSYAEWRDLECGDTKVFACPGGDGSWLNVSVRNVYNQPIGNVVVDAGFSASCDICVCPPVTAITDTSGEASIHIRAGVDVSGGQACCFCTTVVTCLGVKIPWRDTGGALNDTRDWLSPDMNGNCEFDNFDETIFLADYGSDACRSDYNCSGLVDVEDYAVFAYHWGGCEGCDPIAGVGKGTETPAGVCRLAQNYPNPAGPLTRITFTVTQPGRVTLRIYDIVGRRVRTLVDERRQPNAYEVTWDGRDDAGREAPSGVYFLRLQAGDQVATRKVVLIR